MPPFFIVLEGGQAIAGSNPATPTFVPSLFASIFRFNHSQSEGVIKAGYDIAEFSSGCGEASQIQKV